MIQADLALGLFKAPFDGPAAARHLDHRVQSGRLRGKHDVRREFRGVAQTPAHQEPAAPVGQQRRGQGEPLPIIPPRPFGSVAGTQPTPVLRLQGREEDFDLLVSASTPDIFFLRDGQDLGVVVFLQPHAQRPIIPIDTLPCHPGGVDTCVESAFQHLLRELWLGRKGVLRRNPRALAACDVVGPLCGEIEFTIESDMALRARRGQKYPNVAICSAAGCSTLLARHSRRMLTFFEKSRLIDDEYGLGLPQRVDHRGPQVLLDFLGLPLGTPSQMLHPIRRRLSMDFRHVPPVFALDGTQESPERRPRSATGFSARKTWQDATFYLRLPDGPGTHRFQVHV